MKGEWPKVRVADIADTISDTHKFNKDQLVFLNTSDILLGKILHHSISCVRDWPGQAKKSVRKGDILFSEIRPANGRWAYIDIDADDYVVSTKLMVIRSRAHFVNSRYLYHFLTCAQTTSWLQHLAESRSGTFPQITFDQIAELDIALPSLPVQAEIVRFLDTLDDKIELNRKMNETLEAMARALFKSWFVDFDPVRAKMEGRWKRGQTLPGLPADLYDLFPGRFVDSELGEIPEGWEVKTIGDLTEVLGGSTPDTKEPRYWEGGTHHWATPKDLSELQVPVLLNTERCITDAGLSQIGSGLMPKGTVLLSSRAPIGYLAVAEIPVAINQGFIAMKPKSGVSNIFLLLWARFSHEEIISRANGSTFLEISKSNFRPIPVVAPAGKVMQMFEHIVRPLYERIVECAYESSTLTILRDTLLPKLISGELHIRGEGRYLGSRNI